MIFSLISCGNKVKQLGFLGAFFLLCLSLYLTALYRGDSVVLLHTRESFNQGKLRQALLQMQKKDSVHIQEYLSVA